MWTFKGYFAVCRVGKRARGKTPYEFTLGNSSFKGFLVLKFVTVYILVPLRVIGCVAGSIILSGIAVVNRYFAGGRSASASVGKRATGRAWNAF